MIGSFPILSFGMPALGVSLGGIGIGEKCCVKTFAFSEEGLHINHFWMDTHDIRKWDPLPLVWAVFIPGKGDSIFIHPFILKV